MAFASLYLDKMHSDITIRFSGQQLPCHKLVLCSQSEYFDKLFGERSCFAESKQSVVELKEDEPVIMEILIQLLYLGDHCSDSHERAQDWVFYADVANTARKFMVTAAGQIASRRSSVLLDSLEDVSAVYDAIATIREEYSNDDNLLEAANHIREKHHTALLQEPDFRESLKLWDTEHQLSKLTDWADSLDEGLFRQADLLLRGLLLGYGD